MAKLNFNLAGFSYQHGLSVLLAAYEAALAGAQAQEAAILGKAQDYARHLAAGGAPIEERTEDGDLISSQEDIHAYELEIVQIATTEMRRAFAVAAYHYWERTVSSWRPEPRARNHDEVLGILGQRGYPVHPELDVVRHLANVLKHDKPVSGRWLVQHAAALLKPSFRERPNGRTAWADGLVMDEQTVRRVFDILRNSGPASDTIGLAAAEW